MNKRFLPAGDSRIALLLLLFFLPGCLSQTATRPPGWEQYYEPVEELAILEYLRQAQEQAENRYAPPAFPIAERHLRLSIAKTDPALLSRADILDWSAFSRKILKEKETPAEGVVGAGLSEESRGVVLAAGDHPLSLPAQVAVVADLNRWLLSGPLPAPAEGGLRHPSAVVRRLQLEREYAGLLQPMPAARLDLPAGLELCTEIPGRPGHYVLWVSVPPGAENFYPQLGHETLHLLNNRLYDWYVEGLASVFSERMSEDNGHSWQAMREYFAARRETDPYAISYAMMRDLDAVAGPAGMRTFLSFAVWTDPAHSRMHIDIDGWLNSLGPIAARPLREVILRYADQLRAVAGHDTYFAVPREGN